MCLKFTKFLEKINCLTYIDDIKVFAKKKKKKKKELETLMYKNIQSGDRNGIWH